MQKSQTIMDLKNFLAKSYTQYHSVLLAINELKANGFIELKEGQKWNIEKNKSYFICRDSSSLLCFKTNDLTEENYSFNIVASHTDSPSLKIKNNSEIKSNGYTKLNIEVYGGTLHYTWLDKPLKIAGRVICKNNQSQMLESLLIDSNTNLVIPSLAIHMNRGANEGLKFNVQNELLPLLGLGNCSLNDIICQSIDTTKYSICDYDLYLTNATENFYAGVNQELLCSPKLDNLTSSYSSIKSLINSNGKKINIAVLFDNEEVGSQTKQGAGGKLLIDTLERLNSILGFSKETFDIALSNSFIVSVDNAHARHPNYSSLNDPTNDVLMGNGIVIKHHANQNYTTDAFSSSIFKELLKQNDIKYQDFFMRSDMRCGSTLGAISSSQISIRSIDIGIGQLAMHSNMETMAVSDYEDMEKCLKIFYESNIICDGFDRAKI